MPMVAATNEFPTLRVKYRNGAAPSCCTAPERWDVLSLLRRWLQVQFRERVGYRLLELLGWTPFTSTALGYR